MEQLLNFEGKHIGVLPQCCAPVSSGAIPSPGTVRAFGFQSILASIRFFSGFSGFPPASKTELLK